MLTRLALIHLAGVTLDPLGKYKIHCATGNDWPPLEAFFEGEWREWQNIQAGKNFKCDHVLSLISLGNHQ